MTLEKATEAAAHEAKPFGLSMTVYRLPAWPADVYGVRSTGKLPLEARRVATFEPPADVARETAPAPVTSADPQGSLF